MKRNLFVSLWLLVSPVLAQESVPNIPFDSVPEPLKLPKDIYFGEVTGVAVNSKGQIFALSRGNTSGPAYAAVSAPIAGYSSMSARAIRSALEGLDKDKFIFMPQMVVDDC